MSQRLGELLTRAGRVTPEQLQMAVDQQRLAGGGFIGSYLVQNGVLSEEELAATISDELGVSIIELNNLKIDDTVLSLIPQNIINKHNLLPIVRQDSTLTVAMIDPSNMVALNDVKFLTGLDVKVVVAKESELKKTYKEHFEQLAEAEPSSQETNDATESINPETQQEADGTQLDPRQQDLTSEQDAEIENYIYEPADSPIVKLVDSILTDAIKKQASDIHLEPYDKSFRIRYRIDGVLREELRPSFKVKDAIVSRLKMMAGLDIEETRVPQDGRLKLALSEGRQMDCKINALQTTFGEKLAIKFFDSTYVSSDTTKLGFELSQYKSFKKSIHKNCGIVVVSGPSGSGKTTTLYSTISELNNIGLNIITIEDPVEVFIDGVNQFPVNHEIGLNYASALNVLLQQDPDVIMIGEISDKETIENALKASDSGHLVITSINANDIASTLLKILNLNVSPVEVISSINCIVSQKLIRKVCQNCSQDTSVKEQQLLDMGFDIKEFKNLSNIKVSKGCQCCSNTGYHGRVAIFEVLFITDQIRSIVSSCLTYAEIQKLIIDNGMTTFKASALKYLKEGITTLEEVKRVVC